MDNGIISDVCRCRRSGVMMMTDDPPFYGIDRIDKWVHEEFSRQMEHWLEWAWNNHKDPHYRSQQTVRGQIEGHRGNTTGKNYLGSPVGGSTRKSKHWNRGYHSRDKESTGSHVKKSTAKWFNNWDLFSDWKKYWRSENPDRRMFLHYTDAAPELHLLLDFMEEQNLSAPSINRVSE